MVHWAIICLLVKPWTIMTDMYICEEMMFFCVENL